ncbi:MAG: M3 family metallopeptidase, partial [Cryobacterium sp.]|nr:M3 family metallopeptidase [Cryobacterium sp.]
MTNSENPFSEPSKLPFELPPFAEIIDEHYLPAFEQGFKEHLAEVQNITRRRDMPSFENTLVTLEQSGQTLTRVARVFYNKSSADSNDFTNELEEQIAPMMAAHEDAIKLDSQLYWRIKTIYDQLDDLGLNAEQRYLVERYYTEMTLAGAGLSDEQKEQLKEFNRELSVLTTKFEKNLLADTNDLAVVIDDVADLDGLGAGEISAAAEAAKERGLDGKYLVTLVLPTGHPWLSDLTKADVRERIMTASRSRGSRGGEYDNSELVLQITKLRAERAKLLGFDTHAGFVTADETAKNPEAVATMLGRLAPPAARNAKSEQNDLEKIAGHEIKSWDWAYFTEKVRTAKYDVDTAAMRPYFEAEKVLQDGVFFAANQLYGIQFKERKDLIGYHPDVRVFEVSNEDGSAVGLFLYDLYTRDSKRGGAWMNELVAQSYLLESPVVVVNNHNVPKPAAGEPTLLTYDEVNTLFHEFGHALHGLFARVTYPKFTGTSVFRDFVEFPSQVNEMWMLWPEVLANYAVHYQTGEPMPKELVEKLEASRAFNEGFKTSEYLAAALLDQAWHSITSEDSVTDVVKFEAEALAKVGLDNPAVPTRYSSTYFAHTFS